MKNITTIMVLCFFALGHLAAQNIFGECSNIPKERQEEYLINIFLQGQIIYVQYDHIENDVFLKKMEIQFVDTSLFFAGYISSSFCTKPKCDMGIYEVDFVQIDDGGDGWDLYSKDLEQFPLLKKTLDILLREMYIIEYVEQ